MTPDLTCRCGRKMLHAATRPGTYRCGCGNSVQITNLPALKRCRWYDGQDQCQAPGEHDYSGLCQRHADDLSWRVLNQQGKVWDRFVTGAMRQAATQELTEVVRQDRERIEAAQAVYQAQRDAMSGVVYYAELRPGIVKIGTTRHLPERMRQLRARPDDLLATEPGSYEVEAERHRQFRGLRVKAGREDFRYEDPLTTHVATLRRADGR